MILIAPHEVVQKFGCRGDPGYQQMIPCARAGDVEKMALGVIDFLQIGIVVDRLNPHFPGELRRWTF